MSTRSVTDRLPRAGMISATVLCVVLPDARERGEEEPVKVRMTIFSGPDFKTPTITRGAIFESGIAGRYVADRIVECLESIGIPIDPAGLPNGHEPVEPLLPPGPFEGGGYRVVAE